MPHRPPGLSHALRSLLQLLRSLRLHRPTVFGALLALLAAGAAEASSVGLLIPLLAALTGANQADSRVLSLLNLWLPGLGASRQVALLAVLVLALIGLKNALGYCALLLTTKLRRGAVVSLRSQMFERVLHAAPDALEKMLTGDLGNAFLTEGGRTAYALETLLQLTQRGIVAASYATAIIFISWKLTALTVVLGFILAGTGLVLSRGLLRESRKFSEANTTLARRLSETFGGLRLVRTTNAERREAGVFAQENEVQARAEVRMIRTGGVMLASIETLSVACAMGLTAIAHRFLLQPGLLSVPEFLAFGFGLVRLLPALNQIHSLQTALVGLSGAIEQTLSWLTLPTHPAKPFGRVVLGKLHKGIEFRSVGYTYPNGHVALRDVSFSLPVGRMLAIVGPSGSGKSTLASLLLRLRMPTSGQILLDDHDHWEIEPSSFCRSIAYVEQDPFMFHASIAANVMFGSPDVTRADVQRVLATVALTQFVEGLPQGIDTVVGERGATLSGGQRQRLAIARALLRSPSVLILDEPTSALDPETEREVVEAIQRASAGRTTIVIAHRQSTIERADLVLTIRDGMVAEIEQRHAHATAACVS